MRAGPDSNPIAAVFFAALRIHPTRHRGFGNWTTRNVQEFCHSRLGEVKVKRNAWNFLSSAENVM